MCKSWHKRVYPLFWKFAGDIHENVEKRLYEYLQYNVQVAHGLQPLFMFITHQYLEFEVKLFNSFLHGYNMM